MCELSSPVLPASFTNGNPLVNVLHARWPLDKAVSGMNADPSDCLMQEPISQSDSEPSPGAPFGIPIIEELLADSFLQQLFAQFFSMLHEEAARVSPKLLAASKQVQQLLQEKLGWEFGVQDVGLDEEEDEYAPTVVQLDGVQL